MSNLFDSTNKFQLQIEGQRLPDDFVGRARAQAQVQTEQETRHVKLV